MSKWYLLVWQAVRSRTLGFKDSVVRMGGQIVRGVSASKLLDMKTGEVHQ